MQKTIPVKALSLFVALVLMVGVMPLVAFAAGDGSVAQFDSGAVNGVTATVTFDPPTATSGSTDYEDVYAIVTLAGTATDAGDFTLLLHPAGTSGITMSDITDTITVTQGQNSGFGSSPYSMQITVLPTEAVDESFFEFTFTFSPGQVVPPPPVVPVVPVVPPTPDTTPSGSSNVKPSKSSGGGGGGGKMDGAGSTTSTSTTQAGANVSANGAVNSTAISSDLSNALKSTPTGGSAVVSVKNAVSISASTLKSLAAAAAKAGKDAVIRADTLAPDGSVQGRLYVEPSKLTGLSSDIKLGVTTTGKVPEARKSLFEKFFKNNVSIVSCAQKDSFGTSLKIAAKVELPKNTDNLKFYSYNAAKNEYAPVQTEYKIDKNGYIIFKTALAGDIVISDGPLARK